MATSRWTASKNESEKIFGADALRGHSCHRSWSLMALDLCGMFEIPQCFDRVMS